MVYKIEAFLFLLLVVVHFNISCAEKLPTGTGPSTQLSRIAYGWEASILEHPYMINIWRKPKPNEFTKFLNLVIKGINWLLPFLNIPIIEENEEGSRQYDCGGTLITRKCILTAAHCAPDDPNKIVEFYGGNSTSGKGILLPELESVFLDGYDPDTTDMDVAILKLTEPVKDPNLKTVEIDYSEVNEGETITVAGWGKTEIGTSSTTLKETYINVTNTEECRLLYLLRYRILTENMLCAIGSRKEDACGGDSGGPIIRNGKQIGIVSFGEPSCGYQQIPVVYTKLSSVRVSKFLRQTIANNC